MITELETRPDGTIMFLSDRIGGCPCRNIASLNMLLIRAAWGKGCDFEAEADGYGPGAGTHGDWSGIRDSSRGAKDRMLEKALNFLELDV